MRSSTRPLHPLGRGIALFLVLSLVLPPPAYALRQAGLEEAIDRDRLKTALLSDPSAAAPRATTPAVPTPPTLPVPVAGMEEVAELKRLLSETEQIMRRQERTGLLRRRIDQVDSAEFFTERGVAFLPSRRGKAVVLGDRHGDWATLEKEVVLATEITGYSAERNLRSAEPVYWIFVGDYTDIGKKSLAVVSEILRMKVADPEHVVLISGNHDRSRNGYDSPDYTEHSHLGWFFRDIRPGA